MRSLLLVALFGILLITALAPLRAEESPSGFDFLVEGLYWNPSESDTLVHSEIANGVVILFQLEDIESYELATHTITLKSAMKNRLENWVGGNTRRGPTFFHVRVNGEVIYSGKFHSVWSSSFAKPGPTVSLPLLMLEEEDGLTIGLTQPAVDLRDDKRIVKVLSEAGVLVE